MSEGALTARLQSYAPSVKHTNACPQICDLLTTSPNNLNGPLFPFKTELFQSRLLKTRQKLNSGEPLLIYVICTPEKCFNLSAIGCFALNISEKVAEGFDFQTFQKCSGLTAGKTNRRSWKTNRGVGKSIGGVVGTIGANGFCVGPMKTRVQAKPRRGCKPSAQGKRAKRPAPWVLSRGVRCAPGGGKSSDRSVQIHRQRRVKFPM